MWNHTFDKHLATQSTLAFQARMKQYDIKLHHLCDMTTNLC